MFDLRVMLIVTLWSCFILLAIGLSSIRRGLGTWALALSAHTVANILISLRSLLPAWLGVVVPNVLLAGSATLFLSAILEFHERRLSRAWIAGPMVFVLVAWAALLDRYVARVGIAGALLGSVGVAICAQTYRLGRAERYPARWMVIGGFALYTAVFLARLFLAVFRPESLGEHLSTTAAQNMIYVSINLFVLPTSIGFLSMHRERAERELERRKAELERLNETLEERVASQVSEIVARSREVERLNVELRQMVQERSDELARALEALARPGPARSVTRRLSGRFVIEAPLGRGGMGEVYRALDEATGERVALKVISARSSVEFDSIFRFLREAQASARVDHPAIVHARLVDVADGVLFQIFELVDGVPLDRVLRARGALPPGLVARLGAQLASALAAAHAAGVVHRDIKPGNVMITRGKGEIRLLDFGISKLRDRLSGSQTATGVVMGTPAYMAPEQALGSPSLDEKCDIYSTGLILFELLSGRRLFDGPTSAAVMLARLNLKLPPPSSLLPEAPPGLAALVWRCLAQDPSARPSAAELAGALAALVDPLGGADECPIDDRVEALDADGGAPSHSTIREGNTGLATRSAV